MASAILSCLILTSCQHTVPAEPVVTGSPVESGVLDQFQTNLEALLTTRGTAGVSAGIVHNQQLVWSRGFGYADVEGRVAATPVTPYRIGTCSQVLAAVLLMKLVEEGMVDLDDPMANYSIHAWFPESRQMDRYATKQVTVREVLENASGGAPGSPFRYEPGVYADLTWVIEQGSGLSYPKALVEYILGPARMDRTVPGQLSPGYEGVLEQLAKPYDVQSGNPLYAAYRVLGLRWLFEGNRPASIDPVELDPALEDARRDVIGAAYTPLYGVNASVGVISTIADLARFDAALDRNEIVTQASKDAMFTPARDSSGAALPEGLGWFVQDYDGVRLVWQFGDTSPSISALYIKVPERSLTFIALANTDRLCSGDDLQLGDVTATPVAKLFLDTFVAKPKPKEPPKVKRTAAPRRRP